MAAAYKKNKNSIFKDKDYWVFQHLALTFKIQHKTAGKACLHFTNTTKLYSLYNCQLLFMTIFI